MGAVGLRRLLQLIRPSIPEKPSSAEIQAPPEVRQILEKSCYSCHSDQRRLSWFDQIQPAYWLVRKDILTAREHLDFSTLGSKPAAAQKAALYEAVKMIQLGAMPLPRFVALHPQARVSSEDLAALKAYLSPWAPLPAPSTATGGSRLAALWPILLTLLSGAGLLLLIACINVSSLVLVRAEASAIELERMGGHVELMRHPGRPHTILGQELEAARSLIQSLL